MWLVGEVACSDDVASFGGAEDDDGGAAVVASGIAYHLCAGGDEVTEVFVGEVLCRITHLSRLAVDLNESILFPSPR